MSDSNSCAGYACDGISAASVLARRFQSFDLSLAVISIAHQKHSTPMPNRSEDSLNSRSSRCRL